MHGTARTYASSTIDAAAVRASLAECGFEVGEPVPSTIVVLDTFDGRLHEKGLLLQTRADQRGGQLELSLREPAIPTVRATVSSAPRFAADVAPGPLGARLAEIVDHRALLPMLTLETVQSRAVRSGPRGVETVTLFEWPRVDGRIDERVPANLIEIEKSPDADGDAGAVENPVGSLGIPPVDADAVTVVAAAVGVDLAGFSSSPGVPLDAGMSALDGYRIVLANLARTISANWQGTLDQIDAEFLHDLRVAVRRTRTVIGQGRSVLPADVLARQRDEFAWFAALTGPARDLDVYLIEWPRYTRPLGAEAVTALEPVRSVLEQRRACAHVELAEAMRSERATNLMRGWNGWLDGPGDAGPAGPDAQRDLGKIIAKRITKSHGHLIHDGRVITVDTPSEDVHELRKRAKRLRYLLECFGDLLADSPRKAFVRRLKSLQDNLGEHQDAAVHVAELRPIAWELEASGATPATMAAIGYLLQALDERRSAARTGFAERFDEYDSSATRKELHRALQPLRP